MHLVLFLLASAWGTAFAGSYVEPVNYSPASWMVTVEGNQLRVTGHLYSKEAGSTLVHGVGFVDEMGLAEIDLYGLDEEFEQKVVNQGSGKVVNQGSGKVVNQGSGKVVNQGSGKVVNQGSGKINNQGSGKINNQGSGKAAGFGSATLIFSCSGVEGVALMNDDEFIIRSPAAKSVYCSKG